jgi:riboflavin kinase / FMN adenylyltransferase
MQPLSSLKSYHLKNTWLTIGSFDGVHRGHQEIVKKLSSGAHAVGAQAVVLTFFPTLLRYSENEQIFII